MNDERSATDPDDDVDADAEPTRENALDRHDDAVIAADATGMLAGERFITETEIEEGLDGRDAR